MYKIFISSVQKELSAEREAVKKLISEDVLFSEYFTPYLFEGRKGAKHHSARKEYTDNAADCDIYLGIIGNEYGKKGKNKISPVEREYNEAKDKCVYILIKGKDDSQRKKDTQKFLKKIKDEVKGHCYKRFKTINELEEIVKHSLLDYLKTHGDVVKGNFEDMPAKGAAIEDISAEKIAWFIKTAKAVRDIKINEKTKIPDFLKRFELIKKGRPTVAAVLLFGAKPQKFFRISEINCAHFPGIQNIKPILSQHIYEGTLFDQIDSGIDFILSKIDRAVIQKPGRGDFDRPFEIPEFVVEEAITNAVVHRNYALPGSVQVGLYADRFDVWSPGRLVNGLTLEDLKDIHSSRPRNPKIAEMMFLAGYIQKRGTGIEEMMNQCRAKGLPEPEFKQTSGEFVTTIRRDIYTEDMMKKAGLNERQVKAVKYVKLKGKITNKEYQAINEVSNKTAYLELNEMIKLRIFEAKGKGKSVMYVMKR